MAADGGGRAPFPWYTRPGYAGGGEIDDEPLVPLREALPEEIVRREPAAPAITPAVTPGAPPAFGVPPPEGAVPISPPTPQPRPEGATPIFTQESPFVPKTLEEAKAFAQHAPPGSVLQNPEDGKYWTQPEKPKVTPDQHRIASALPRTGLTPPEEDPSTGGVLLRSAGRAIAPTAGSVVGAGGGATAGMALGAGVGLLFPPIEPVTIAVGGFLGGLAGAIGGGYAIGKAQEAVFAQMPDWALKAIGQLPAQQQADIAAHPIAEFIGGFGPQFLAFPPRMIASGAATAAESIVGRLAQNPYVQRMFPAAIFGGQEAATELVHGEDLDPTKIGIATGVGALAGKPSPLGEKMLGWGSRPVETVLDRFGIPRGAPGAAPPPPPAEEQALLPPPQRRLPPPGGEVPPGGTPPETPPGGTGGPGATAVDPLQTVKDAAAGAPAADTLGKATDTLNQEAQPGASFTAQPTDTSQRGVLGFGFGDGQQVQSIMSGGAAEKAGLKVGDVIAAVNGQQREAGQSLNEWLYPLTQEAPPGGAPVTLRVMRKTSTGADGLSVKYEAVEIPIVREPEAGVGTVKPATTEETQGAAPGTQASPPAGELGEGAGPVLFPGDEGYVPPGGAAPETPTATATATKGPELPPPVEAPEGAPVEAVLQRLAERARSRLDDAQAEVDRLNGLERSGLRPMNAPELIRAKNKRNVARTAYDQAIRDTQAPALIKASEEAGKLYRDQLAKVQASRTLAERGQITPQELARIEADTEAARKAATSALNDAQNAKARLAEVERKHEAEARVEAAKAKLEAETAETPTTETPAPAAKPAEPVSLDTLAAQLFDIYRTQGAEAMLARSMQLRNQIDKDEVRPLGEMVVQRVKAAGLKWDLKYKPKEEAETPEIEPEPEAQLPAAEPAKTEAGKAEPEAKPTETVTDAAITEANAAGMNAFDEGQSVHDNPHQAIELRNAWHEGWVAGDRQRTEAAGKAETEAKPTETAPKLKPQSKAEQARRRDEVIAELKAGIADLEARPDRDDSLVRTAIDSKNLRLAQLELERNPLPEGWKLEPDFEGPGYVVLDGNDQVVARGATMIEALDNRPGGETAKAAPAAKPEAEGEVAVKDREETPTQKLEPAPEGGVPATVPKADEAWSEFNRLASSGDFPNFSGLLGSDWAAHLPVNKTSERYLSEAQRLMTERYGQDPTAPKAEAEKPTAPEKPETPKKRPVTTAEMLTLDLQVKKAQTALNKARHPDEIRAAQAKLNAAQAERDNAQGPPIKGSYLRGGGPSNEEFQAQLDEHEAAIDARIHEEGSDPTPEPQKAGQIYSMEGDAAKAIVRGTDTEGHPWVGNGNALVRGTALDRAANQASKKPGITERSGIKPEAVSKVTTPNPKGDYQPVTWERQVTDTFGNVLVIGSKPDGTFVVVQKPIYDAIHAATGMDGTVVADARGKNSDRKLLVRNAAGETIGVGMPRDEDQDRARIWARGPEKPAEPAKAEPAAEKPAEPEKPAAPAAPAAAHPNAPVVTEERHTKTGKPVWFVRFPQGKPDIEDLGKHARRFAGQWSSYQGGGMKRGWMFKGSREDADQFAAWANKKLGAGPEKPTEPDEPATGSWTQLGREDAARNVYKPPSGAGFNQARQSYQYGWEEIADDNAWKVRTTAESETAEPETELSKSQAETAQQRKFYEDINGPGSLAKIGDRAVWLIPLGDGDYRIHMYEGENENQADFGMKTTALSRAYEWAKGGELPPGARPLGEEKPAPTEEPEAKKGPLPVQLADNIVARLEANQAPISERELRERAESIFGGTLSEGKYSRDTLYDALELAVNKYIKAHPDEFDPNAELSAAKRIVRELEELKDRLPTQTVRAGEKDSFQQFSTPPDYAYAVARAANIGPDDRVIEPSAGTGGLAVHAMNANPDEVFVNELSANRAPLLESLEPTRAFRENAEQLNNILPKGVKPTIVVMNPPFSATAGRMGNQTVLMTGARHIEQALSRLEPGGRLVAIVGRGMRPYDPNAPTGYGEGTGATFRDWWHRIGQEYDVRANIGVSGDVYKKYGTNFGTRLLIIDKAKPSGRMVTGDVASIPELLDAIEDIRNDRPELTDRPEQLAAKPGGTEATPEGESVPGPEQPVSGATATAGVREEPADAGAGSEVSGRPGDGGGAASGSGVKAGASDAVAAGEPERGGRSGGTRGQPDVGTGKGGDLAGGDAEPDGVVLRPQGEPGSVLPASAVAADVGEPAPEVVRIDELAADPETAAGITENVYEPYQPQRITIKGAKQHPTPLVQTAAMASVLPPDAKYVPKLPAKLISEGKLSAAQLEAVIYAGETHEQMLPEVTLKSGKTIEFRKGFFIGDGTGVGKGAQVAGIILDNSNKGRKKAVWISESRTLINDAKRDWSWLGQDPKDVFDLGKTTTSGAQIKAGQGIAFLTYDTLKMAERVGKDAEGKTLKGQTRIDQLVAWLGEDFDGVIAFDESHNLANGMETRDTRGIKEASQKALAGIQLQQKLPKARVVYVSATGATEVMNLAYAERLGLWGPGTAFPDKREFIGQIQRGGVASMELVARDMKALGVYISRNLAFGGPDLPAKQQVEYDRVEHNLSADQKRIYNDLADGWQSVLQNMEAALLKTTGSSTANGTPIADRKQRTAALSAFWSGHQRFFNQIITSMQMPSVIKGVEADIKAGRQAVLQLVNTNEASQSRAISKARAEDEGDLEDLDMTPRDQLMQLIEKSFPTQQMEEYLDDAGNKAVRPVVDSAGNPVHNPEAMRMKEALLRKLGSIRVPDGPLEILINHFGPDEVAEITGRSERVVRRLDKDGNMRAVVEKRPGSANVTEADAFQNGKKRILVFSQAGMTGRSYHADLSSPSANARRSHYLVQAGWRADKAIQGFGRTHRTNQDSAPIFHLVTTDLQGQRRFISSIARRLAQLGALTKGERRAGESGMFSAKDNLESTEAEAALGALWRDIQWGNIESIRADDFEKQTGLKLRNNSGESTAAPKITQFLNRLLSLKFELQNEVFGEFETRLTAAIDKAAAAGTLDVGTETLKADKISKEDDRVVHTDPVTGAETRYVRLKTEHKNYPRRFREVEQREPDFYVRSKRNGRIAAVNKSTDVTNKDGGITQEYRLTDPLKYTFLDRDKIDGPRADQYWEKITNRTQARQLWDEQVAKLPEYAVRTEHLITGAILPIWDRLKGWPTVYRLQTDAGEKMLGRTVHDDEIDDTLKRLGAEGTGRQYSGQDLANTILAGGSAELSNGWRLRKSYVGGEPRIELIGPDYSHENELEGLGVFIERIQYRSRYFIPTGENAGKTLDLITARRPAVEVTRGRGDEDDGLAAPEDAFAEPAAPTKPAADKHTDLMDDYQAYAKANPSENPHETARAWVTERGKATGFEHLVALDEAGNVIHAYTSGQTSWLDFSPALMAELRDKNNTYTIHHNHPSERMHSGVDLAMLGLPGLDTVVVHTPDGEMATARLAQGSTKWLQGTDPQVAKAILLSIQKRFENFAVQRIQPMFRDKKLTAEQANRAVVDISNRMLEASGMIDYMSSYDNKPLPDFLVKALVRDGVAATMKKDFLPEDFDARVHRSTRTIQPAKNTAGLSHQPGQVSQGRPGDQGSTGAVPGVPEGKGEGLSAPDDNRNFADSLDEMIEGNARDAADRLATEAGGGGRGSGIGGGGGPPSKPPDPPWSGRFFRMFGFDPKKPWSDAARANRKARRQRNDPNDINFMNAAQKIFMTAANAARYNLGGVSREKYAAHKAKSDYANAKIAKYVKMLKDYVSLDEAGQKRLTAFLELQRLQGADIPFDNKPKRLTNTRDPLAQHSKVGETVELTTPAEIRAFRAHRKTMDAIWADYLADYAAKHDWNGPPTAKAINEYAKTFGAGTSQYRRWRQIAKLVGAVQFAKRDAYVPFMRNGDYYFVVKPKEGTRGWTGEGMPPTIWYSRIDARSPAEKLRGGRPSNSRVDAERAEILKAFPEAEYEVREGWYKPEEDSLRDLNINEIEELFNSAGRDVMLENRQWIREAPDEASREYRIKQSRAQEDLHERTVDAMLNRFYEAIRAGYRKQSLNIPGYEADLLKSTGQYVSWLSNAMADMKFRDRIDAADRAVDKTPDKITQEFWYSVDKDRDRTETQLDHGAAKLKTAAFYWALAGNAATALKNMLDGPLMGLPVLSTGFGSVGRVKVYGTYVKAMADVLRTIGANTKEGITMGLMGAAKNDAERALLQHADDIGLTHARGMEEFGAITKQGMDAFGPRASMMRRVLQIWSSNFTASERAVRGAMLLAAFRTASEKGGMDTINKTWSRDKLWGERPASEKTPEEFAAFMVDRTAGIWEKGNRSEINRNLVGGIAMQMHQFEANWISTLHQQMWHMGPEGKMTATMMLGGLGMMAGALGLPFAQDLEKSYEWVHKTITGVDPNLQEKLLQFMEQDPFGWGKDAGYNILHGWQPFGVDWSSLGMGAPLRPDARTALDVMGAAPSMLIGAPLKAYQRSESGQGSLAMWSELMPSGPKNLMKAFGVWPEEGIRTLSRGATVVQPEKITGEMQAKRAIGFASSTEAKAYAEKQREYRAAEAQRVASAAFNHKLSGLYASMTIADRRGDKAAAADFQRQATQLMTRIPEGVKVSREAIKNAIVQAISPEAAALKQAPKAQRGEIAQRLFGQPTP